MPWTAAIVAGGPASRLGGRDKSSLRVGDRSILERQLDVLRPLTDRILIVANNPDRFRHTGLPVLPDRIPDAGALGGVYTALAEAMTPHVIVIAGDMPFLSAPFLEHLSACADGFDLVIPRSADGLQPMCALYSTACLPAVRARIGEGALRVQDLAADVRTRQIGPDELAPYDPNGVLFFNVNTPADHQRAIEWARQFETPPQRPDDRITHVARAAARTVREAASPNSRADDSPDS